MGAAQQRDVLRQHVELVHELQLSPRLELRPLLLIGGAPTGVVAHPFAALAEQLVPQAAAGAAADDELEAVVFGVLAGQLRDAVPFGGLT